MDGKLAIRLKRTRRPSVESLELRQVFSVFFFGSATPAEGIGLFPAVPTVSNQAGSVTIRINPPDSPIGQALVSTSDGTAKAGVDYSPINQTVSFRADSGDPGVTIPILNSGKVGGQETFNVIETYPNTNQSTANPNPVITQTWTLAIENGNDVTPPVVQDLDPIVKHHKIVQVQLTFNKPMDVQTVENPLNYSAFEQWLDSSTGLHRRPAPWLSFRSAAYDPTTNTVTLTPRKPLKMSIVYELDLGQSPPTDASPLINDPFLIADSSGNEMQPETGVTFGVGRSLKYQTLIGPMTGNWAVTKLSLSGPGQMVLKDGIGWDQTTLDANHELYVLGTNRKRSVLTGTLSWTVISPGGLIDKAHPYP
jgi:Calx-beta domain